MYFLVLALLLTLWAGLVTAHEVGKQAVPLVEFGFLSTPTHGPYSVLLVHDQDLVAVLCGYDPAKDHVWGCANWIEEPAPAGRCTIIVQDTPDLPRDVVQTILAHELRHCVEGEWHDQEGNDIPGIPEQHKVPDTSV